MDFLKIETTGVVCTFNADIPFIEYNKDHFHMLFKATPLLNIPTVSQRNKDYNINGDTAQIPGSKT
jgi:hypothetical protein